MTTRSTALCSSERIFASFKGSRLPPERSSKSSDLGARIHSVPRSSRRHGARAREFKLECQFGERGGHAGAGGANAQIFKPFDQFRNSPTAGLFPREASHRCFPQVDAKSLDFNEVLPGAGRLLSFQKCRSRCRPQYHSLEKCTKLKRCNIAFLA